jgi:hypothetical protein
MVINMSCSYNGCPLEIRNYCTGCPTITNWCDDHSNTHENEPDHYLISITNKELNIESLSDLNSKIQNYIVQIANDTEKVIIALKKASSEAIKNLKKATRNMKSVSELEGYLISQERISFLVAEVGEISNDIKISTLSKISDLKRELYEKDQNLQNIESLKTTIAALEEKEREMEREKERELKRKLENTKGYT